MKKIFITILLVGSAQVIYFFYPVFVIQISKNELIKSIAKKIDNGLADIWSSAYESKKLPCNIKLVIFNSTTKKELYSSYWSYQYCEFYFDTKVF